MFAVYLRKWALVAQIARHGPTLLFVIAIAAAQANARAGSIGKNADFLADAGPALTLGLQERAELVG